MKRITDPDFKYTPAVATDIRETFRRVRLAQQAAMPREELAKRRLAEAHQIMRDLVDINAARNGCDHPATWSLGD